VIPKLSYQTRLYFHGLMAAGLSGGANAITVLIVDPVKFNVQDWAGLRSLLIAVVISAVVGFATYLKAHPLPDPQKDSDAPRSAQIKIAEIKAAMSGTADGSV